MSDMSPYMNAIIPSQDDQVKVSNMVLVNNIFVDSFGCYFDI
jgi:hypothetical protein